MTNHNIVEQKKAFLTTMTSTSIKTVLNATN